MPSSTPSPDRFQREIDDIIRLAEKRLERQSIGSRARRSSRRLGNALGGFNVSLPRVETLAGLGLALMLASMLMSLLGFSGIFGLVAFYCQVVGLFLLFLAIVLSVTGRKGGGRLGGEGKMWRGERIAYGNPYGDNSLVRGIRRFFGRR
jgi:hypothetical protein